LNRPRRRSRQSFAVVANEVKKTCQGNSQATEDISAEQIEAIQTDTKAPSKRLPQSVK